MKQALYLLFCLCFILGCEKEPSPIQISISTGSVTDITPRSVFVQVSIDRHEMIREVGVLCSTDSLFNTGIISQSSTEEISGTTYKFQLSNLLAGTKYFYKAYASGKSGNIYGLIQSFTTEKAQLSISLDTIEASDRDSTYKIEVKSNMEWQTSSSRNWCEVSPKTGSQRDSINIKLEENTSTDSRQVIVTITAGNQSRKVTINQKGMDENLSVSSNYFSVSPENNSYSFLIQTNLSWTVTSNQPWCVPSSSSGDGEYTLSFTMAANPLLKERSALITIKAGSLIQEVKVIQQSESAILSVSKDTFNIDPNKNNYNFTITSNMDWTVSSDQPWCVPTITTGSNDQTVYFDVTENASNQKRTAIISIEAGNLYQIIAVIQNGTEYTLSVSKTNYHFGSVNASSEVLIRSNTDWTISSNKTWCTVSVMSGSNNQTLILSVLENTAEEERNAIITVKAGDLSQEVTVKQDGISSTLSLSKIEFLFGPEKGDGEFLLTSNTHWTVESNESWCTVNTVSGNKNSSVSFSVSENTSVEKRTAILTIKAGQVSKQVRIEQEGFTPILKVSQTSFVFNEKNNSGTFTITSNTDWNILCESDWCTIEPTSGTGNATITVTVKENPYLDPRSTFIIINGHIESVMISLIQKGATSPNVQLSSLASKIEAEGNSDCYFCLETDKAWNISSNKDWCHLKTTQGYGNSIVYYSVDRNLTNECRMATLSVFSNNEKQDFIVLQDYYNNPIRNPFNDLHLCYVSYESRTSKSSSRLKTPTNWVAVSDQDWCQIQTPSGNNGDDLIIDYNLNNTIKDRMAIITITSGGYTTKLIHIQFKECSNINYVPNIEMVNVEGGEFIMGNNNSSDAPEHIVYLDDFQISKYEITQDVWVSVMNSLPSNIMARGNKQPVTYASWKEIQEFISKLNTRTGLKYRLPTEAEWEYAAKGGNLSRKYTYSGSNIFEDVGWNTNIHGTTSVYVGAKKPNELGIYDMSGNVPEYCSDWYDTYLTEYQINPTGPESGIYKVVRGFRDVKNTDRDYRSPDSFGHVGFRLVLDEN